MPNRVIHSNSDPDLREENWEAQAEVLDDEQAEIARDLATEEIFDTQHGDGHTYNPQQAWEQGLVYTPPDDPPVLPSDDPQGASIAAGFDFSAEEPPIEEQVLSRDLNNRDVEVQDNIYRTLRVNSETQNLTGITVRVHNGTVTLLGTVPDDQDSDLVESIVADMAGVDLVQNRLETEN